MKRWNKYLKDGLVKYKNKTQNQELKNWVEFIINPEKKMQGESKEIEKL